MATVEIITFSIGVIGSLVIIVGLLRGVSFLLKQFFAKLDHNQERTALDHVRLELGRYMILGLEFFIAKDIIETLIIPTWNEIGMLGALVLIRTILSFFLTREIHQTEKRRIEHRKIDAGIR